jgi:hypothetical protein
MCLFWTILELNLDRDLGSTETNQKWRNSIPLEDLESVNQNKNVRSCVQCCVDRCLVCAACFVLKLEHNYMMKSNNSSINHGVVCSCVMCTDMHLVIFLFRPGKYLGIEFQNHNFGLVQNLRNDWLNFHQSKKAKKCWVSLAKRKRRNKW